MNDLINLNITKKDLENIIDIDVKLEYLLKIIKKIDCEVESYMYMQDPLILDNLYEDLGGAIVKIEDVIRILKENKYALQKNLKTSKSD